MNNVEIFLGVGMFIAIVLALVFIIMFAKSKLVPSGDVTITINGDPDKAIKTAPGGKLLGALADAGYFVSSACGGGGSCGQCRVDVHSGGGEILPTELDHITKGEAREGCRLSCQVAIKQDMEIELEESVFGVKKWDCEVISNDNKQPSSKSLSLKFLTVKAYLSVQVATFRLKRQRTTLSTKSSIFLKNTAVTGSVLASSTSSLK